MTIADLEKALSEKQQLEERLEAASLRYMVAERKLDRARSLTVAKLEKQYIFGAAKPPGPENAPAREEQSPANGGTPTTERSADAEDAHIKLAAVSEKQKEQLRKLETDNSSLLTQITDLKVKHSKPTDEDYAHTDLFKQLKSQYEDVVKRINHLEATNVQLREEAEKLRSERIAYRNQVDDETRNNMAEREAQLVRAETDLARIRNARDELLADQQMRKAAQEQEKTAGTKARELADAGQARITSLESEIGRLRLEVEQSKADAPDVEQIPVEELRTKYTKLERQYSMLNTELNSMQTACKKYSSLAAQKVADFSAMEEKVSRLTAEKSKADQKYFAAMKSKESRDQEVRMLRMQNSKSSDIISQLKESESASRSLLANMEKHVSESKEALNSIATKHRVAQQQVTEGTIKIDGLRNQVSELKALSASKDSTLASTSSAHRQAETEIESLKATLADTKKSLENWKTKSLGNSSSEYEMLRVSLHLVSKNQTNQVSHSHSAQSAAETSKTQSSNSADTSSAATASKSANRTECASARTAADPLATTTTCALRFDLLICYRHHHLHLHLHVPYSCLVLLDPFALRIYSLGHDEKGKVSHGRHGVNITTLLFFGPVGSFGSFNTTQDTDGKEAGVAVDWLHLQWFCILHGWFSGSSTFV